jgi:hypothetical protein
MMKHTDGRVDFGQFKGSCERGFITSAEMMMMMAMMMMMYDHEYDDDDNDNDIQAKFASSRRLSKTLLRG